MSVNGIPALGPLLDADVLDHRTQLPLKPPPVSLIGSIVRLDPYTDDDLDELFALTNGEPIHSAAADPRRIDAYDADELVWRFMSAGPFATRDEMALYMAGQVGAANGSPYTARLLSDGRRVGVINMMNSDPANLKIELGSIFYSPVVQRTGVNTEATYLCCRHAFGVGFRRVEWKCNARNLRSREAALKMGFRFEGIQEQHFIVKGVSRDTAWFRLLDHEWPSARAAFEAKLYG